MSYVYVLVSNESNEPVYFDNFTVSHERGQLIGEDHYYAYGLKIASISSKSVSSSLNLKMVSHGYQGSYTEEVTEFELNYSEFYLRTYDPQIGRWTTTDPYDQFASPYSGMGMDPGNNIDPSGGVVPGIEDVVVLQNVTVYPMRSSASSISMGMTVALQSTSMLAMGSLSLNRPATDSPLREATSRKSERWGSTGSTGGGAAYQYFETEYYHRGSTTYNTKAGWYTQEAYIAMLGSEGNLYQGKLSPAKDLAAIFIRGGNEMDCSEAPVDRLYRFFAEIGEIESSFYSLLGMAGKSAEFNSRRYVSGYTEASSFNVEDMVGIGLLTKGLFSAISKSSVKTGGRVFWSGEGAMEKAMHYAKTTGGTTLEMTRVGQNLQKLIASRNIPWPEARPMWERLSAVFAKGATGTVHFFQGKTINPSSIWLTIEKMILNKKNVKIINH